MLLAALGVGAGFGLGFYPAWYAAGLDPVDALRYEEILRAAEDRL